MDAAKMVKETEKRVGQNEEEGEVKSKEIISDVKNNDNEMMEQNKVSLMRAFVETQDPNSKEVDDLMIRRFLRVRDLDIEKASAMFLKYLKWKQSFVLNGFISETEIQNDLAEKKMFLQGLDKNGRPIVVAFGGKHFPKEGGLDELKRFVVYTLDKICARMPRGQEKFIAIVDLKGWGYSNSDIRGKLGCLPILQDYYPNRLGKVYLVHVPYLFMKVVKLVYPFIDNNIRKTVVFVENKNLKSTLLKDIDENQLPEIYGGKQALVPIEES